VFQPEQEVAQVAGGEERDGGRGPGEGQCQGTTGQVRGGEKRLCQVAGSGGKAAGQAGAARGNDPCREPGRTEVACAG